MGVTTVVGGGNLSPLDRVPSLRGFGLTRFRESSGALLGPALRDTHAFDFHQRIGPQLPEHQRCECYPCLVVWRDRSLT
jgi:hypothetical protein